MSPGKLSIRGGGWLGGAVGVYIETFGKILMFVAEAAGIGIPRLLLSEVLPTPSIDRRLAKLEVAKAALMESLSALEELQRQAEDGKIEHERVRAELAATIANKDDAERKLQSIQALITQDVEAFQTLAGVPDVGRERLLGFASGVVASVIASGVVALIVYLWKSFAG